MNRHPHARRLALVSLVGAAASLSFATAASAAWTKAGTGAGTGAARTLAAPGASNTCTKNTSTYTIVTSWAAVTGASTYKVERSTGGAFTTVQTSSAVSYTATETAANTTYSYKVTALAGTNWVSLSATTTRTINNGGNCAGSTP